MSAEPDWTLLGQYFRGACTAEEVAVVERWEAASVENARTLELLRRAWHEAAVDEDEGWRALQARIAADARAVKVQPLRVLPHGVERTQRSWLRKGAMAAAAAIVVATAGVLTWRRSAQVSPAALRPAREYVTARGERGQMMLVDGTRVWLSVGSRLRVREGYGVNGRDVELEGEAYFVVEHDSTQPFRVHTRGAVSEDLGTEFNVRAYGNDDLVVAVANGRVAIRSSGPARPSAARAELGEGQVARLDRAGHITIADDTDLSAILAWRDGALRFKQQPLAAVLRELERWYDLDIVLEDSTLAQVPVTTALNGRTADQALGLIASALDVGYRRTARAVHFGGPPPHR